MSEQYHISTLFKEAFGLEKVVQFKPDLTEASGYTPVEYNPQLQDTSKAPAINFDIGQVTKDEAIALSQSGIPVLYPLTFKGKGYKKYDSTGKLVDVQMNDFRLPASTIMELSRDKAETTTVLSGGVGSVIEMYGFENWQISIKGICFNESAHPQATTPAEQKKQLYRWEQLASSINIESELMREFDIYNLFIKRLKISQIPGKPQFIPFEIDAISDTPIELLQL